MKLKTFDWSLYLVPLVLWLIGVVTIYSITYLSGKAFLARDQLIWGGIGLILMVVLTFIDYRNLRAFAYPLYFLGILLLLFILYYGKTVFGATRWFNLGIFQLQPSELFKLFLVIFLARFFGDRSEKIDLFSLIFGLILIALPLYLILRQPDIGTASILLVVTIIILAALKLKRIYYYGLTVFLFLSLPFFWSIMKGYQKERLFTFFHPLRDPAGSGYNIIQSLIAVGSGGLYGRGLSHSTQSQLQFLPIAHTDFIFAGFAETTGFLGSVLLVLIFLFLIWRIINVALVSKDNFGTFFALGAAVVFLFEVLVNIGMNIGLMPITGIPLPFVSYGGSALLVNFMLIGILESIYLRHKKISF